MKTIDKYLIKQFIGPFIATFFIALFVLMMQFIWVYVDDIVGKGAGLGLVLEIIFYKSISLIPWALPIAILISSVMLLGNLGERYELASLKSAGVPLIRVMRPLLYFTIGITIFSFICSNNLIPVSNLKFQTRLRDISRQKPTLNLEQGVFNRDFGGFNIHIGKKEQDNKTINDVIIYDEKEYNQHKLSMITADKGEMFMTDDNAYFVMNLKNGTHYQEGTENKDDKKKKYPFVRTNFEQWTKIFTTDEFNINLTDIDRFKNHYTMLTVGQLFSAVDSIDRRLDSYHVRLDEYAQKNFTPLKKKLQARRKIENDKKKAALEAKKKEKEKAKNEVKKIEPKKSTKKINNSDSKVEKKYRSKANNQKPKNPIKQKPKNTNLTKKKQNAALAAKRAEERRKRIEKAKKTEAKTKKAIKKLEVIKQNITKPLTEYASFYHTFSEADRSRFNIKDRAKTSAKGVVNQASAIQRSILPKKESRVKHIFTLYSKITFALACCVFLFIGAPMGAIVRKGGFGYPLLISIVFFMLFIVLNILFQKLAESMVLPAVFAAWCPILILIPLSARLTYRAMKDKKVVDLSNLLNRFSKFFKFFSSKFNRAT